MRRVLVLLAALILLHGPPVQAQVLEAFNVTAQDTVGDCSVPSSCASFQAGGSASLTLQVAGTFTGTLTFEATADGVNWLTVPLTNLATGAQVTTTTAPGAFAMANPGILRLRARATAAMTGIARVTATRGYLSAKSNSFTGGTFASSTFTGSSTMSGPLLFSPDNTHDIGASGANRPRDIYAGGSVYATMARVSSLLFPSLGVLEPLSNGRFILTNSSQTIGVTVKVDALPTAGACGTAPAVIAGSTPYAGSINVGTATPASCVVVFGGTAFPSNPFCVANVVTGTAANTRAIGTLSTTTQLTLVPATAFVDSSLVAWHCISAR
jgi:hypothetical protein